MDKWRGKVAVVTGASAGIGESVVKDLARAGMIVIGLARRVEKIEKIKNEMKNISGKIYAHCCDVSDPKSVKETFSWISKEFKTVHVLVNNAGIAREATPIFASDSTAFPKFQQIINTNFAGLVQCTQEAYNLMKQHNDHGFIININSIVGHSIPAVQEVKFNVYPGTKHAVTATTEVMRRELVGLKHDKIRVASVSPGVVKTEFRVAGELYDSPEGYASMPHLNPEDISDAILYLLGTKPHVNITEITIKPVGEPF